MKRTLKFYKTQQCWFVDLPQWIEDGGSMLDLQMVQGADTWLDSLAGSKDEVTLSLSTTPPVFFDHALRLVKEGDEGADYIVTSNDHSVWLCPVTVFVFGKYPEMIYVNNTSIQRPTLHGGGLFEDGYLS